MNQLCQSSGLVGGKSVHGVDENRLYARLAPVTVAIIENGINETFGFAGACSGGNDSGLWFGAGQTVESIHLVTVGGKLHRQVWKIIVSGFVLLKGELNIKIGTFKNVVVFGQKISKDIGEKGGRYRKGGAKEILYALFNVLGQDRRDHDDINLSSISLVS
jgi:hypothetical protein